MAKRVLLAALVAGLLAAALVAASRRQARQAGAVREEARLLSFDDRAVTGLELTSGGVAWSFARDGQTWRLVKPVADTADSAAVTAVIGATRRAPVIETVTSPDALSSYGLDPPEARLAILGPEVPAIDVGRATPAMDGVYVRVSGRPGVLVAGLPEAAPLEHANPLALRDASWLGIEATGIRAIAIERGGATVSVARRGESWWITSPRRLPAAGPQVDRLAAAIAGTRVTAVDDRDRPDDPKLGLGAGGVHIEVTAESGTRRLALGAEAEPGHRFATNDARGTVLVVDTSKWDAAPTGLDALRDPRLTDLNRYAVVQLTYEAGPARFSAVRSGEKAWRGPSGAALDPGSVYALLASLLEARTTGFTEGAPASAPAARLSVTLEDGASSRVDFYPNLRATWDAVPGAVFSLAAPPPPVPPQK